MDEPAGDRPGAAMRTIIMQSNRRALLRHGIAPASVAIAFAARTLLAPILQQESTYLLFVPAVLVSAGVGGLASGIVATVLSLVLGTFFLPGFPAITIAGATSA